MQEVMGWVRKADVEKLIGAKLPTVKNYLELGTWDADWDPDTVDEMRAVLQHFDVRMRKSVMNMVIRFAAGLMVASVSGMILWKFATMLFG